MHLHHCRCFQEHVRILFQSLRALCKAPGGAGSIYKYLEALARATGVFGRFAYGFETELHFADGLGNGRVKDKNERDESRWEIIFRNWDIRKFHVHVNLPFLILQAQVLIRWEITLIQGLVHTIRHNIPLISNIRSYPLYGSNLHPPSLFLVRNSTIIARIQS